MTEGFRVWTHLPRQVSRQCLLQTRMLVWKAEKSVMANAYPARQQLPPDKGVAPCQVPVASPQRHSGNYYPPHSSLPGTCGASHTISVIFSTHPGGEQHSTWQPRCPGSTWQRKLNSRKDWVRWKRHVYSFCKWGDDRVFNRCLQSEILGNHSRSL